MGKFTKTETGIDGLIIVEPKVFGDSRGFFMETYNKRDFEEIGLNVNFIQDNHSKSRKGVLRGLHFQTEYSQGKLIRVIKGIVYDVAVDMRAGSPTYGKYFGLELTEDNKKMFYVPEDFAHGFIALSDEVEFLYKVTDYYYPEFESGIIWDDPEIGVKWPLEQYGIKELILSDKDKKLKRLSEM